MSNPAKQMIIQCFLELLNDKPFHRITVKEIVKKCDINRNTFYYHFEDIYDLLEEVFREEIERSKIHTVTYGHWQDTVLNAMRFLIENKKATLHIFNSIGQKELRNYLKQVFKISISHYFEDIFVKYQVCDEDKDFLIQFYTDAIVGITIEWIEKGLEEDYTIQYINLTNKWFAGTLEKQIKHYYQ